MSSRIPPLLEPYLTLPSEASLILLTSVLGASTNWLVLRFLHSALIGSDVALSGGGSEDEPKVLLVSFMRDAAFWKENAKRLSLDLDKVAAKKRFAFVDGLSGLFLPRKGKPSTGREEKVLSSSSLESVSEEIHRAIQGLKSSEGGSKVLLVVDQLDLLLAAGGDTINSVNVGEMLMGLREDVHVAIITVSADYPLVSGHQTPLEYDHAAFLLSVAHQADFSMGVRLLDSGTAKDVSGVVRITVGDDNAAETEKAHKVEEKELLYFVGGDGGVKVFERGQ